MAAILNVTVQFTGTSALITAKVDELAESELIFDEDINVNRVGTSSTIHKYLVVGLTKNTLYKYILRFRFKSVGLAYNGQFTTNSSDEILRYDGTTYLPDGTPGTGQGIGGGTETPPDTGIGQPVKFLTVDYYHQLPAADLNSQSLFLVLKEENTGVATKYGGFYRSNGTLWEYLGASTSDILGLSQLTLTSNKNFDSEVTVDQVGKGGYFGGFYYFAHTVGPEGSGLSQWSRVSIANKGF